ncbi:MAG: PadR family transcriptional regulator [Pseudomonadota bacterium]
MALAQAIMTALIDNDLSGYELAKDFESSVGFFWHASHQQIYQELHKLADRQLLNRREVSQSGKPNKIVYGLTKAGRDALAEWVYGNTRTQAAKDELLIKLYNLNEQNAAHLAAEILDRRQQMMRTLYVYEKIRKQHYAEPGTLPVRHKGVYLALSAGMGQGEQFLAWCDEALELLALIDKKLH